MTARKTYGLTAIFNDASRQPAHRFEMQTGVRGIAGQYVFPGAVTAAEHENIFFGTYSIFPDTPGMIRYPRLFDLHPDLPESKRLQAGDEFHPYHQPSAELRAVLEQAWADVAVLNPVLQRLELHSVHEKLTALAGAVSGFNADDIQFFVTTQRTQSAVAAYTWQHPDFMPLYAAVEEKTGRSMGWVPCVKTLRKIVRQLK